MKECKGKISSIYNGTALDGPGIRSIVFLSGCNLRCPFCHNPETLSGKDGEIYTPKQLFDYLIRYKNYIKNGGVTFSGGEPFLQAEFCLQTVKLLKQAKINTAVETNCSIIDTRLLNLIDIVIADVKNYDGKISKNTENFFESCLSLNKKVIMTNVLIKGVNDDIESLKSLKRLYNKNNNIIKFEFLPFKKLCVNKYKDLNLPFIYKDKEETENSYSDKIYNTFMDLS